jgi:FixJ family two-component response regulator
MRVVSARTFFDNENSEALRTPVISIVDDDADVREATANLVRSLGLVATRFASAEDFLASDDIDETWCLIADVQLPGLSGIELQSRLRADGRRTPVIFITAFPEDDIRIRAFAAGAFGFLSKPYDPDTLVDCLDRALGTRPS